MEYRFWIFGHTEQIEFERIFQMDLKNNKKLIRLFYSQHPEQGIIHSPRTRWQEKVRECWIRFVNFSDVWFRRQSRQKDRSCWISWRADQTLADIINGVGINATIDHTLHPSDRFLDADENLIGKERNKVCYQNRIIILYIVLIKLLHIYVMYDLGFGYT